MIIITEYDAQWPAEFAAERARLLAALGPGVLEVEHIGSTSVPGLAAKPIVDLLVGVRSLSEADRDCVGRIQSLGYECVPQYEDEMPFRRFFKRNDANGTRLNNLHPVVRGEAFWTKHLLFRDYLRHSTSARQRYEAVKRALAPQFTDGNAYAAAKTEIVTTLLREALAWRGKAP